MRYHMSQAELKEAVQYYLNEKVLRNPVTVRSIDPTDTTKNLGVNYVLHVVVTDDQNHLPDKLKAVGE